MSKKITFYTDGACIPNPGKGSWAYVQIEGDNIINQSSGLEENVTNNRMELMAIFKAIESTSEGCEIHIISDSEYCVNIYTKWYMNWIKKNKFSGKSNIELIHETWKLKQKRTVTFSWVRGHDGNKFNEIVDNICAEEINPPAQHPL